MKEIYITRDLEKKINKYLKRKEIIAIVGPRQCGKTTLMKHVFSNLKNGNFVSFDDRNLLKLFDEDISLFIKKYVDGKDYLFIDEFQYSKDGGKQLKFIYDSQKIKILISGSSAPELSIQSIKYLVGRVFVLNLYPLSFLEFLNYKYKKLLDVISKEKFSEPALKLISDYYEEYCIFGGYPAVVISDSSEEKIEVLKNVYNTYLLREIRDILQISDDSKLISLMKALALQTGSLVNYKEISLLSGLKYDEVVKNVNILRNTFVCLESKPFFRNKRKELVKSPKIYFLDLGFRNFIINDFRKLKDRQDFGGINENFVACEISRKDFILKFWRTKAGAEVDFVIEKDNDIIPIEVKTTLRDSKYGKSLKNFVSKNKSKKGFILSFSHTDKIILEGATIRFAPIFLTEKIISHLNNSS